MYRENQDPHRPTISQNKTSRRIAPNISTNQREISRYGAAIMYQCGDLLSSTSALDLHLQGITRITHVSTNFPLLPHKRRFALEKQTNTRSPNKNERKICAATFLGTRGWDCSQGNFRFPLASPVGSGNITGRSRPTLTRNRVDVTGINLAYFRSKGVCRVRCLFQPGAL